MAATFSGKRSFGGHINHQWEPAETEIYLLFYMLTYRVNAAHAAQVFHTILLLLL